MLRRIKESKSCVKNKKILPSDCEILAFQSNSSSAFTDDIVGNDVLISLFEISPFLN